MDVKTEVEIVVEVMCPGCFEFVKLERTKPDSVIYKGTCPQCEKTFSAAVYQKH